MKTTLSNRRHRMTGARVPFKELISLLVGLIALVVLSSASTLAASPPPSWLSTTYTATNTNHSGSNTLQNVPILSPVSTTAVVQGTFNSSPSSTFTLEFFYSTASDPGGYGEGETPDGSTVVTTDAAGNAIFTYTLPAPAPSSSFLTATATDASGNTSAFSQCQQVQPGAVTATPTCQPGVQCVTPTSTPTNCPVPPGCSTDTPSPTPTCQPGVPCNTPTPTPTSCGSQGCPTDTPTSTPTCQPGVQCVTPTSTDTSTATAHPTFTSTSTSTVRPTDTTTNTPANTSTITATPTCQPGVQCTTPTSTSTNTPSNTPANTFTNTATGTSTRTSTVTQTRTPTATPTCIVLGGYTPTVVATATIIIGTQSLGNQCNDCLSQLVFPFPVQFYGDTYQKAVASSNGNVQFVPESVASSSSCLPNPDLDTAIMLYQGDLDTSGQGEGIYSTPLGTEPNRIFALEWRAHYADHVGTANAELIFYENSSTIEMVYGVNSDEGVNEVSGMQLGQGVQFDEYSCHQPLLTAGKKIVWTWHPPIIICTPTPTRTRTSTPTPTATICVQTLLSNGFESGTLEGYTSAVATCVPGGCGWTNVNTAAHAGTRSLFAPDVNNIADQQLISPAFTVPSGLPQLVFWHRYALEHPLWDGGIIEISPNGGPWATVTPSAISPTYPPGTIPGSYSNPLVGKQGWTNQNPSYPLFDQITVNLSAWAGVPNTRFRFRLGTDIGNYGQGPTLGWWIDDITVTGTCATPTMTPTRTVTPSCVATPVGMTHWWPLDETSGSIANELVFGANATEYNAPAHIPGKVAFGLSFNGVNQYAAVMPPSNSPQLGTGNFTGDYPHLRNSS
jgi:hypothetical protein